MKYKKYTYCILIVLIIFGFFIFHATKTQAYLKIPVPPTQYPTQSYGNSKNSIISAFRQYKRIDASSLLTSISVPSVVEIPFNESFERSDFAVINSINGIIEPHYFIQNTRISEIPITIFSPATNRPEYMIDKKEYTHSNFALPDNYQGEAQIRITSQEPITSSSLTLLLEQNVALPNTISISALTDTGEKIILAPVKMTSQTIKFPVETTDNWIINLTYTQPLRLTELYLQQINTGLEQQSLRFLAQPNTTYRIYFDPDRRMTSPLRESGNLRDNKDVVTIIPDSSQINPLYKIADIDNDQIPDIRDNCVQTYNPHQIDINNNGRGDLCDDFDKDGVMNNVDNCQNIPNRNQLDTDSDGIGDACDTEESRITERHSWIPWAGIGFAAIALITLFALTTKSIREETSPHKGTAED